MKCKNCSATMKGLPQDSLSLECTECGNSVYNCHCCTNFGRTPDRIVHCRGCGRENIGEVDTTEDGWRSLEV